MEPKKRTLPLSEYAQELRSWLHLSRHQYNMMSYCHQQYLYSAYTSTSQAATNNFGQTNTQTRIPPRQPPPRTFPLTAGSEVKIPTIGKRLAAECIDCVILYCIKFFLTYLLVTFADIKASHVLDFDYAYFITGELELEDVMQLSSEIVLVEFIHRLFVAVYEGVSLAYVTNIIPPGGFTPGKRIMGLAVISCDEVFSLGNDRFLVTGMQNPSLRNALIRSVIKNFSLSFFVPTSLTVFLYEHKRAIYDLVAGTVVIELPN